MNDTDLKDYLQRIGITKIPNPDIISLIEIHKAHLLNIPFENLSIHYKEPIHLDERKLFQKIISNKRGGFCYELNGLFFNFLQKIEYGCKMISARVFGDSGKPGPEFDHMAIIVNCEDKKLLCDVGFGDSFYEPLELINNKVQSDQNKFYVIREEHPDNFILYSSEDKIQWEPQYSFTELSRSLNEYEPMCIYHQTSSDSHFTQKIVCTKATENGRITLTKRKLIITEEKNKTEFPVENDEIFRSYLQKYFQIQFK